MQTNLKMNKMWPWRNNCISAEHCHLPMTDTGRRIRCNPRGGPRAPQVLTGKPLRHIWHIWKSQAGIQTKGKQEPTQWRLLLMSSANPALSLASCQTKQLVSMLETGHWLWGDLKAPKQGDISKLRTWSSPFSPWPAEFILNLERPRWLGNEELIVYTITLQEWAKTGRAL